VQEVAAYSTVAMTLSLVVSRPRVHMLRVTPAMAAALGVVLMMLTGVVGPVQAGRAFATLWQPFAAIVAIMATTAVAHEVGVLGWLSARVDARAGGAKHLFTLVFVMSALTATALNNDAAVLLLTPLVVGLVRKRYPDRADLVGPFAFAVFMSAGVAPLMISNPINMIIAEYARLDFNTYLLHMAPVAVVGWAIAYVVLRLLFRQQLASAPAAAAATEREPMTRTQKRVAAVLLGVLPAYAAAAAFGGPVWIVAVIGASLALAVGHSAGYRPAGVIRRGVCFDTLIFLACVLVLSVGLLNVGLVARLAGYYDGAGTFGVGAVSALGSAALNNHPMAHINMMALRIAPGASGDAVWAVLIGGDLGPRLLPMGSLAGLLWFGLLRRQGVHVSLRDFCVIGALVTIPTMLASLAMVAWLF